MKRIWPAAIVVVVASIFVGGVVRRATSAQERERATVEWEYLIVAGGNVSFGPGSGGPGRPKQKEFSMEAVTVERNLDRLGADGWELVSVYGAPNNPTFYLKRSKGR